MLQVTLSTTLQTTTLVCLNYRPQTGYSNLDALPMLEALAVAYAAWAVAGIAIRLSGVGASCVMWRHVSLA